MAWTKLKIAGVVGGIVLVVAGAILVTVAFIYLSRAREAAIWDPVTHIVEVVTGSSKPPSPADIKQVQSLPQTVSIRPTQFASQIDDGFFQNAGTSNLVLGVAMPASGLFGHAYGLNRTHIVNPELLPPGKYDFVVNLPNHRMEALQTALKKQFGLVANRLRRETNVLVLTVASTNAPGLKPGTKRSSQVERFFGTGTPSNGHIKYQNRNSDGIATLLEHNLEIPVSNQTELEGLYNFELETANDGEAPDLPAVNKYLLEQLGLKLTPATQTMEMLVLKKVK
jgi:uncharacterized protein (TIGR03435 family)